MCITQGMGTVCNKVTFVTIQAAKFPIHTGLYVRKEQVLMYEWRK